MLNFGYEILAHLHAPNSVNFVLVFFIGKSGTIRVTSGTRGERVQPDRATVKLHIKEPIH